jgi:predicted RNA binding protein YcfA (HicA-like mRNA interferase family)
LPAISGYDAIKTLRKAGFVVARQKGSHVRLKKDKRGDGHQNNGSTP